MAHVVLTGGHGFIGSRVSRLLAARGDALTLLVRKSSQTHRVQELRWRRVEGDVLDADSLRPAFEGQQTCVHLASITAWSQLHDPAVERTIEAGTMNVLEAARRGGVQRVVFVSSVAALGGTRTPQVREEAARAPLDDPRMRYAISKRKAEDDALEFATRHGLELVIVRPGEVYGPEDDGLITAGAILDILKGWPALAVAGGVSVVHVDDVAQGVVAAMDRGRKGEAYHLGGENLTITELVRLAVKLAGKKTPVVSVPSGVLAATVAVCLKLRVTPPVVPELLPYVTRFFFVSSEKAKRELGFAPRGGEESLRAVLGWLRSSGRLGT